MTSFWIGFYLSVIYLCRRMCWSSCWKSVLRYSIFIVSDLVLRNTVAYLSWSNNFMRRWMGHVDSNVWMRRTLSYYRWWSITRWCRWSTSRRVIRALMICWFRALTSKRDRSREFLRMLSDLVVCVYSSLIMCLNKRILVSWLIRPLRLTRPAMSARRFVILLIYQLFGDVRIDVEGEAIYCNYDDSSGRPLTWHGSSLENCGSIVWMGWLYPDRSMSFGVHGSDIILEFDDPNNLMLGVFVMTELFHDWLIGFAWCCSACPHSTMTK